ncbi:CorA family divalent cation transporter [Hydrogenivirga sp. 128-5-R1-1]|uniref:CorA family divalent cation transporter n=1 Tax=Hydrogenivirga sp. 128-5-R1-1 TaxID=392423 RepID=UPI00015F1B18|nr:CorA family divalent cation transporter [Hydrogenivirga sp. 128-5-R1-1]EDP74130.1 magnesium and cobalt transport protein CorA [Hydrogenivirga sp. 128-5-R1-1]
MIRVFIREGFQIRILNKLPEDIGRENILWVDLFSPTEEEKENVEKFFNLEIPTKQKMEEIEVSSRYFEDEENIKINAFFLVKEGNNFINETVSFILSIDTLITVRYRELKTFSETAKRILSNPKYYENGYYVFTTILEIRIDSDADTLEFITREINRLSRIVFTGIDITQQLLESISYYEDYNMTIRENLTDKQRLVSSLLKSYKVPKDLREELRIMIKDINSLIDYTNFNFDRLDYLQNTFLGLINIEQNKVMKIFTLMSVIFLPPTLIAAIYGMTFNICQN